MSTRDPMAGEQGDLLLGVDGGGTKTVAWLARCSPDDDGESQIVGRGKSGPANSQAIGSQRAVENLDRAVQNAFEDAGLSRATVRGACFGLAGVDRADDRRVIEAWIKDRHVADHSWVTNDALPILYAATDRGVGIALIAGTGSLCLGRNAEGLITRCGGWGYLFGDEGSAYWIAMEALRAAARSADGRGPETGLLRCLMDALNVNDPSGLITVIYSPDQDRAQIAKLAAHLFQQAQDGDDVAKRIVDDAARSLAEMVLAVARRLELFDQQEIQIAVTGGVLLNQPVILQKLQQRLQDKGVTRPAITTVADPVFGAIQMAGQLPNEE